MIRDSIINALLFAGIVIMIWSSMAGLYKLCIVNQQNCADLLYSMAEWFGGLH